MFKIFFKLFFLICFFASFSFCQGSGDSDADKLTAKGLILAFEDWPNTEEENLILEKTEKAGLKKKTEHEAFKTWVFEWENWHKAEEAEQLCEEFFELKSSDHLKSLDYCEEDVLLPTG